MCIPICMCQDWLPKNNIAGEFKLAIWIANLWDAH